MRNARDVLRGMPIKIKRRAEVGRERLQTLMHVQYPWKTREKKDNYKEEPQILVKLGEHFGQAMDRSIPRISSVQFSHSVMSDSLTRLLYPWGFLGKNTRVGCYALLQGMFQTQGLNLSLLHWQADSLPLSNQNTDMAGFKSTVVFFSFFCVSSVLCILSLPSFGLNIF